jgi:parallel beta-helix repeat protein
MHPTYKSFLSSVTVLLTLTNQWPAHARQDDTANHGLHGTSEGARAASIPITSCGTIPMPGSSNLNNNLTATVNCLVIAAGSVTLDLAGFRIRGAGIGVGISGDGVARREIHIQNGMISNFAQGISLVPSRNIVIKQMHISGNGVGIVSGDTSRITDNTVSNNGHGIFVTRNSIITGNTVNNNKGAGIDVRAASIVSGNIAIENDSTGIVGGADSTITGNTASNNGGVGVKAFPGSTISGNTTGNNTLDGISVDCPGNVMGNTATSNGGVNLRLIGNGCTNINNLAR